MELKDYVKEVISQISEAVSEINNTDDSNNITLKSPIVNPTFCDIQHYEGNLFCILERTTYSEFGSSPKAFVKITNIDFDVTLSASSKSEKGGKNRPKSSWRWNRFKRRSRSF